MFKKKFAMRGVKIYDGVLGLVYKKNVFFFKLRFLSRKFMKKNS